MTKKIIQDDLPLYRWEKIQYLAMKWGKLFKMESCLSSNKNFLSIVLLCTIAGLSGCKDAYKSTLKHTDIDIPSEELPVSLEEIDPIAYTKYYKYRVYDRNWMPLPKYELSSLTENNGTGYEVAFNDCDQFVSITRIINNKFIDQKQYIYNSSGKIFMILDYDFSGDKDTRIFSQIDLVTWMGDVVKVFAYYSSKGELTHFYHYDPIEGNGSWVKFSADGTNLYERRIITELLDDVVVGYKWVVSPTKYYSREIDPETGFWNQSKCYVKNKYDFRQKNNYSAEGVITSRDLISSEGIKYATDYFDVYGRRMKSEYNYKNGHKGIFIYERDDFGDISKLESVRNGRLVYTIVYERFEGGAIKRSIVYDNESQLIAEYPGRYVEFLNRDGSSKSAQGIIHKKIKLW
jgi:hypothetical protein